jgi:hypothetical protein
MVQGNLVHFKLNALYQSIAYTEDINLLCKNINSIQNNAEIQSQASKN